MVTAADSYSRLYYHFITYGQDDVVLWILADRPSQQLQSKIAHKDLLMLLISINPIYREFNNN